MPKPILERLVYCYLVLLCGIILLLVGASKFFAFDTRLIYQGF